MSEVLLNSSSNEAPCEPRIHIDLHLHLMVDPELFARLDPPGAVARGGKEDASTGRTAPHRGGGKSLLVVAISALIGLGGLTLLRAVEKPSPNMTEISASGAPLPPSAVAAGRVSAEEGGTAAGEGPDRAGWAGAIARPGAPRARAPAGPSVFHLN